jgi:hypothetical protein
MPRRCLPFILLLTLFRPEPAEAAQAKTADLLVISGGNSSEYWQDKDKSLFNNREAYFAVGTITLKPRSTDSPFLDVEIWGRGVSSTAFFDLTPLIGVLDGAANGEDVRRMLLGGPPASAGNDLDALRASLAQAGGPPKDDALSLKRQAALEQMASLGLTSFDQLWRLYDGQRKLVSGSLMSDIEQEQLFQLYSAAVGGNADKSLPGFVKFLKDKNLLAPVLRTRLFGSAEPHLVGYVFRVPANALKKTTGQIFFGAGAAEPEALTVNLEMEHEESIFFPWSWTKFLGALFTPTVTSLAGTLLGAAIGFMGFLAQQRYTRRAEIEKKFEEKKIEASKTIREFFTGEYRLYLEAADRQQETRNIDRIRKSLIDQGIYAILPHDEIDELNRIWRSREGKVGERLNELNRLLRGRFGELMD